MYDKLDLHSVTKPTVKALKNDDITQVSNPELKEALDAVASFTPSEKGTCKLEIYLESRASPNHTEYQEAAEKVANRSRFCRR